MNILEDFISWVEPIADTDVGRLEQLKLGRWRVRVFKDQLNRYLGDNKGRDRALAKLGLEVISANSQFRIVSRDDLYLTEAQHVYFNSLDPVLARRQAEFLLLSRRHSHSAWITLLTQHLSYRRVPMVNTYYLDQRGLLGNELLPSSFDFLTDFGIHPSITRVVRQQLFTSPHGHTLFDAVIALRDHVRNISGLKTDGYELMDVAFNPVNPKIRLNPLTDLSRHSTQKNEQKGYHDIYCGTMAALRNTLAHEGTDSDFARERIPDEKTLLKFLCFLSLLCERAEQQLT